MELHVGFLKQTQTEGYEFEFIGGGVLPLAWFMITRGKKLKLSGAGVFEGELSPDSARA